MPQKLLLDTHIWLWSLLEPHRLSAKVARALAIGTNELWISPISSWEIMMLCDKKRLSLQPDAAKWITAALIKVPCREAPLTHEVAVATGRVQLPHSDPADRFLAATALVFKLTLVTADENILSGSGFSTLANK